MKVEGTAGFQHKGKPFETLIFNAEITPDTPAEHEMLKRMSLKDARLIWQENTGRCWLQAVAAEPYVPPKATKK